MPINPLPGDTVLGHLHDRPATPIVHPPTTDFATGEQVALWDETTWDIAEQRAAEHRSRISVARMEVRSWFAAYSQSQRDDFHRAYADLYGMEPTPPGWSNSYTTFDKLAFALNHVVNENEGLTMPMRREVVLTTEPHPVPYTRTVPAARVNAALALLDLWASFCGSTVRQLPPWRIDAKGNAAMQAVKMVERPAETTYVTEDVPLPPVWANPHQIEGGFLILRDSPGRNLRAPGCEGLSILIDSTERLHLVYWQTNAFEHTRIGRHGKYVSHAVGKQPLAVHSFPLPTPSDDAVREMYAVSAGMERSAREAQVEPLLPWAAAEMAQMDHSESVPMIYGSLDWLTAVADQVATGEPYRPHGASSDDA